MQSLGHLCQAVREVGDEVLNGCNSERVSGPGSTSVKNLIFGNISRSRAMAPCSRLLMYYSLAADPCGPAKHCPVFHCPPSGLATPAHDRDDHVDGHPDHDHGHPGGLHPVQLKQKTTRCRKNWAQTLV